MWIFIDIMQTEKWRRSASTKSVCTWYPRAYSTWVSRCYRYQKSDKARPPLGRGFDAPLFIMREVWCNDKKKMLSRAYSRGKPRSTTCHKFLFFRGRSQKAFLKYLRWRQFLRLLPFSRKSVQDDTEKFIKAEGMRKRMEEWEELEGLSLEIVTEKKNL